MAKVASADCFYCQVEQQRLGIPREVPCAVQQWAGLIAVNYAARAAGITRHMRVVEALQKCPKLRLVHVQTLGGSMPSTPHQGETPAGADADAVAALSEGGGSDRGPQVQSACTATEALQSGHGEEGGVEPAAGSRDKEKACLERYRQASAKIIGLLRQQAHQAIVEKASIDEVYIDVTSMVDAELRQQRHDSHSGGAQVLPNGEVHSSQEEEEEEGGHSSHSSYRQPQSRGVPQGGGTGQCGGDFAAEPVLPFGWGSIVLGGQLQDNEFERRLAVGAAIGCRLRGAVREQLGYTLSGGIACNKLLAKIASAMHKPNQQTVVPPRAVAELMEDLPLGRIRNFGGKLGAELQALGCSTAGQVAALGGGVLEARFGERARFIAASVRGMSDEPVQEKERPKSMLAAKSFEKTSDVGELQRWLRILADELAGRMLTDAALYRRHPRNLVLHYRGGALVNAGYTSGRSKSCAMPRFLKAGPQADVIAAAGWKLFESAADATPCSQLSLSATEFVDAPVSGGKSIARFFGAAPSQALGAGKGADQDTGEGPEGLAARGGSRYSGGNTAPSAPNSLPQQRHRGRGTIAHSFAQAPAPAGSTPTDTRSSCPSETPLVAAQADQRPAIVSPRPVQASVLSLWTRRHSLPDDPEQEGGGVPGTPESHPGAEAGARSATSAPLELPDPSHGLQSHPMLAAHAPAGAGAGAGIVDCATPDLARVRDLRREGPAWCATDDRTHTVLHRVPEMQWSEGCSKAESAPISRGGSATEQIDLTEVDLIQQGQILRDIRAANQHRARGPITTGGRGMKRNGPGRAGPGGKRLDKGPKQTSLSRFLGN